MGSTMADFKKTIGRVLKHEGGYVWDPKDPGGETNFGISKRAFPSIDIKGLTKETASELYRKNYWIPLNLEFVASQVTADQIMDIGVNMGVKTAATILQNALNHLGQNVGVDGAVGGGTLAAIAAVDALALNNQMVGIRIAKYRNIVKARPDSLKFLRGWVARAETFGKGPGSGGLAAVVVALVGGMIFFLSRKKRNVKK